MLASFSLGRTFDLNSNRRVEISRDLWPESVLWGDINRAVRAVGMMLTLPNLKQMCFRGHLDRFVEQVIKNNEKKDIISIVPY
jgi:hypothetical protein